jgi:predicted small integral membrane protein
LEEEKMAWMVWTLPTALLFTAIFAMLGYMTFIDLRHPVLPRKGFLPMVTSRGDRLYVGMMVTAFIQLIWLGVSDLNQLFAVAISAVCLFIVMRWG